MSINVSLVANNVTLRVLDVFLPGPNLTPDPLDLAALPALALSRWIWTHPIPLTETSVHRIGVIALGASVVATMATSPNDRITSDQLISRVEVLDDARFVALHQDFIDLGPNQYRDPDDVFDPLGNPIPLGFGEVVYTSTNGTHWEVDLTIDASTVDWDVTRSGCVDATCVEFDPNPLGDGSVTDEEGDVIFTLIEPPVLVMTARSARSHLLVPMNA